MEVFEIHITGDKSILEKGRELSIKTIGIDLLRKDLSVIRSEYMTSQVYKFPNYSKCFWHCVRNIACPLREKGVEIQRIKIESPFYQHYVDRSLYIEAHFKTETTEYPISRNQNKSDLLATVREYHPNIGGKTSNVAECYENFIDKWGQHTVELCLYDSNVIEDIDWLGLWN